ncbi:hypothetical protein GTQ40_10895 [Flavobacteriaceae bacterium R38]|nr:hypothetical protein [Flavobacteriaceae bacterium R38]
MKKKSLNSKKLLLKKSAIASMNERTVKGGGAQTATFQTICGAACGETEFFTKCNGANQCGLFNTQFDGTCGF